MLAPSALILISYWQLKRPSSKQHFKMSLRSQLTDLLTDLLPPNPRESIKGTELIRLVRMKLDGNYSDASLRYHFSIMSCDPSSPIAKVEKGQGYYKRGAQMPALSGAQEIVAMQQGRLDELNDTSSTNQSMLRIQKFRENVEYMSGIMAILMDARCI